MRIKLSVNVDQIADKKQAHPTTQNNQ